MSASPSLSANGAAALAYLAAPRPAAPPSSQGSSHSPAPPAQSGPLSRSDPRTQLHVANLPYRVRWQDLKDLFRRAGTVLRADVALTPDNRSKGHGSVLLATEHDAQHAVDMLNGFVWQGRVLDVRIDRSGQLLNPTAPPSAAGAPPIADPMSVFLGPGPMQGMHPYDMGFGLDRWHNGSFPAFGPGQDRRELAFGAMPSGSGAPLPYYGRTLFVGNIPFHCGWQELKDLFRAAGRVQRADIAVGPEGRSKGFGTVLFATPEDAQHAVRLYHGYDFNGRTLKVHFDRFASTAVPANGSIPVAPAQYTGAFSASMAQGAVAAPTAAAAAAATTGAGQNSSGGIPGLPVPGIGAAGPAGGTALAGGAPLTSSPYVLMRPQQPSPYVQQAMQRNAMLLQHQHQQQQQLQQQQQQTHLYSASFQPQSQPQHFPPYDQSLTSATFRAWPSDRAGAPGSSPALHSAHSNGPSSSLPSANPSPAMAAATAVTEGPSLQRTLSTASRVSSASHASTASGSQRTSNPPSRPLRGESSLPRPPTAATEAANRANRRSAGRPGRIEMPPPSLGYMSGNPGFAYNPTGMTPWGGDSIPATPHAHLPPHILSPGVAFTPGPRLVPSHIPLTPGAPFNAFVNPASGAPVHFHPGTPSAHMPFYMGMPTPLDPATPHWPAPATPGWGVVYPAPNGAVPQAGAQPPTQAVTQEQAPGTPPTQSRSSEGYPFPVVPPQDLAAPEETADASKDPAEEQDESAVADEEETGVKLYAFGQRRASTNSPAVSPVVERRGVGAFVPGTPGTPDRERRLSLSAARGRSALANLVGPSPSGEADDEAHGEENRAQIQKTSSTEELTRTIARMSVRGTALGRREERAPAPQGDSVAERRGVGLSLHTAVSSPSS